MEEEITLHEKIEAKREEMKEKYADICNDLLAKYGGTVDRGFDYLEALARAIILHEEPQYTTDLEFDVDELIRDYAELEELSKQSL